VVLSAASIMVTALDDPAAATAIKAARMKIAYSKFMFCNRPLSAVDTFFYSCMALLQSILVLYIFGVVT